MAIEEEKQAGLQIVIEATEASLRTAREHDSSFARGAIALNQEIRQARRRAREIQEEILRRLYQIKAMPDGPERRTAAQAVLELTRNELAPAANSLRHLTAWRIPIARARAHFFRRMAAILNWMSPSLRKSGR